MSKIYTHMGIDIDAAASVWAVKRFAPGANKSKAVFVPANWDGTGMEDGDFAVDLYAGGKGIKGKVEDNGTTHSAFVSVIRQYVMNTTDKEALFYLAMFIDIDDSGGGGVVKQVLPTASRTAQKTLNATSIKAVFTAMKIATNSNDGALLAWISKVFDGLFQMGREAFWAWNAASRIPVIDGVAIARNTSGAVRRALYDEFDARMIVFVDDRKNALGIHRKDGESVRTDHPLIRAVVEAVGEEVSKVEGGGDGKWFAHPAGFLFCWGSKKAPAKIKSRIRPEDLANAAIAALKAEDANRN